MIETIAGVVAAASAGASLALAVIGLRAPRPQATPRRPEEPAR